MPDDEREELIVNAVRRGWWNAKRLGNALGLTQKEKEKLGVVDIVAIDPPSRARLRAAKLEKKRYSEERRRRAKGAKPRAEYEAESLSRAQPWLLEVPPISKRTWYRRLAGGVAQVRAFSKLRLFDSHGLVPSELDHSQAKSMSALSTLVSIGHFAGWDDPGKPDATGKIPWHVPRVEQVIGLEAIFDEEEREAA
jgi:hypothetical protein